jgi:hypothetical protein
LPAIGAEFGTGEANELRRAIEAREIIATTKSMKMGLILIFESPGRPADASHFGYKPSVKREYP